jgi:hypothetical protein
LIRGNNVAQAQFAHRDSGFAGFAPANDARPDDAGKVRDRLLTVSIFADRSHLREDIREDALAAGLRVGQCGELGMVLDRGELPLGGVVLVDCPELSGERLAALASLDMRVARSGGRLVVTTSIDALDGVFACLDQSGAEILVAPTRAETLVALGRVLVGASEGRLRELSEEDRLHLMRLTEQVEAIARSLDRLGLDRRNGSVASAHFAEGGTLDFGGQPVPDQSDGAEKMKRAVRPALPDPRLVRRIIRQRQLRARFFDGDLFADPAWDILLDLTAARAEHLRVSVTSLCIASGVPPTTALRWIAQMTEAGLLERIEDETDRRRAFVALTDKAADAMARYFVELGRIATHMA